MTGKDRILGSLFGVAYGDAMGMPSEFCTRAQIEQRYGWIDTLLPGHDQSPISKGFRAGEVTDDTIMACILAQLLIDTGDVQPLPLVRRIRQWADENAKSRCVIGPSTRAAFDQIEQGTPIEEAGKAGTTNGAAMKIAPVGMCTPIAQMELLIRRVHAACLPTHNTHAAIGGAAAVAAAVSFAVSGGTALGALMDCAIGAAELGEKLGHRVISPLVSTRLRWVAGMDFAMDERTFAQHIGDCIGTGLPIADSVPAAFAALLCSEGDPVRCARLCANLGGDTDTIGAMATAICGALHGPKAFPKDQLERIQQVNTLDFDALAEGLDRVRQTHG